MSERMEGLPAKEAYLWINSSCTTILCRRGGQKKEPSRSPWESAAEVSVSHNPRWHRTSWQNHMALCMFALKPQQTATCNAGICYCSGICIGTEWQQVLLFSLKYRELKKPLWATVMSWSHPCNCTENVISVPGLTVRIGHWGLCGWAGSRHIPAHPEVPAQREQPWGREAQGKCWAAFTLRFSLCFVTKEPNCCRGAVRESGCAGCSQGAGGDGTERLGRPHALCTASLGRPPCPCSASALQKDTAGFSHGTENLWKYLSQHPFMSNLLFNFLNFSFFQHKRQQLNKTVVFSKSKKRKVLSKGYC